MATFRKGLDWQSEKKTVLERNRYMFNNPFMSDVAFECEDSDTKFFAHKYVLGTSSAVFYAMFYSELAEKNSVVYLSDTNDESFGEFLRFLYTDECNLTADNVMFVLYLAKKYIVTSLADKCIEFLEANITFENVFIVLQQAIQFNEKKLENKCWSLIELKTSEAVAADGFTNINRDTIAELVKREGLRIKEVDLFRAVVKWSEAECSRKGIEVNAKNKRTVIGNIIYQIRFASMTLEEFGQITSRSSLLEPEEIILFYEKFSGIQKPFVVWNMSQKRIGNEMRCCRFSSFETNSPYPDTPVNVEHSLGVSFSKPVKIHGVGLIGRRGQSYDVQLQVSAQKIEKKCHLARRRTNTNRYALDTLLTTPVSVQADCIVHLKASITGNPNYNRGVDGKKTVEVNGITVTFYNLTDVDYTHMYTTTSVQGGQFDEIIFTEI